ncbi:molybdopterin-dependent oxidoreductase [Microbacterium sp. P07]|uniref:molybdopterin-dependent oxidoreductase n=1 Tax=Microbacterium sp. P07 TaxID=3366952 RepID=UPI0037467D29
MPRPSPLPPALAGIASVALGAGAGELLAGLFAPASSPFAVVGGAIIDLAPSWAKDTAIALFGTSDKIALLVGIGLVAVILAAGAGWLEARKAPWGRVVVAAFGIGGAFVAATRAGATEAAWFPAALAGAIGAIAIGFLARSANRSQVSPAPAEGEGGPADPVEGGPADPDRRRFFVWAGVTTATGLVLAIAGGAVRAGAQAVTAARDALRLPAPAVAAPPVPAAAELGIDGLAPVVTPNGEFYRIDTALVVPQVAASDWSLRIHGMVEQEVTLTWDELVALPLEESITTLTCVSNEVGGDLIGNALWLGYPIRELLARARPTADADMVLSRSIDGFTASSPIEALTDERNAILAVGMNGEPLPTEHGFPVRMVVPGLYGYVSATKWVTELEVTRFDAATSYWTDRGWSERGPIKLESRIDVPRRSTSVAAGDTVIAGVAWQQHVGVAGVEVKVDDGDWQQATLATAISDDTWVQWSVPWAAEPGSHRLTCRATNVDGETQTPDEANVVPDGATGWHSVEVTVR